MTALQKEIIRSGTMANQVTLEAGRIVCIFEEATLTENGMTYLAQGTTLLLSASGQFRRE